MRLHCIVVWSVEASVVLLDSLLDRGGYIGVEMSWGGCKD